MHGWSTNRFAHFFKTVNKTQRSTSTPAFPASVSYFGSSPVQRSCDPPFPLLPWLQIANVQLLQTAVHCLIFGQNPWKAASKTAKTVVKCFYIMQKIVKWLYISQSGVWSLSNPSQKSNHEPRKPCPQQSQNERCKTL